jgi:hypothetical protein
MKYSLHAFRPRRPGGALTLLALLAAQAAAADRPVIAPDPDPLADALRHLNRLKPFQSVTPGEPVLAPWQFNPDSGVSPASAVSFANELPAFRWETTFSGHASRPDFNPDTGLPTLADRSFADETTLTLRRVFSPPPAPLAPPGFNPDPGGKTAVAEEPYFKSRIQLSLDYGTDPLSGPLALPRSPVSRVEMVPAAAAPGVISEQVELPKGPLRRRRLVPVETPETVSDADAPIPDALRLPRIGARANQKLPEHYGFPRYSVTNSPNHTVPRPDRARIGFEPWRRYTSGDTETPYESPRPYLWHPYKQSVLKGDVPVFGQDVFMNLTASSLTEVEGRRLPTPSAISSARPDSSEFFGRGEQFSVLQNVAFAIELFQGETAFRPVSWAIRVQPVYNLNYTQVRETTVVSPDPRNGGNNTPPPDNTFVVNPADIDTLLNGQLFGLPGDLAWRRHARRTKEQIALQEAFVELHLGDLSENYDFVTSRFGTQPFNSDFRGFIFNDINLGARIFGNAANNHFQYNVAAFHLLEKDTYSELNSVDARDQRVFIANLYRQDFLTKGYTAQLSFHANIDEGQVHYDRNGNIARPAPIGTVREHDLQAYYLGWTGDGHIGRLNVTHAFYQVYGRDEFNGLAGKAVDIDARMVALELSYDRDWIRYKASFFYASGDRHTDDGKATGFDTILDNPNFTGGPFSYYVHQGFNLAGTAVGLKNRNSLVPSLRTSKTEGQANFVNPGLFLAGVGAEIELTPKLRSFLNLNYIRFAETDPIKTALVTDRINEELGWDLSLGFQYRPFLTDNLIISTGFGTLIPGKGYRDIYRQATETVPGYTEPRNAGKADDFLFSAVLAITITY